MVVHTRRWCTVRNSTIKRIQCAQPNKGAAPLHVLLSLPRHVNTNTYPNNLNIWADTSTFLMHMICPNSKGTARVNVWAYERTRERESRGRVVVNNYFFSHFCALLAASPKQNMHVELTHEWNNMSWREGEKRKIKTDRCFPLGTMLRTHETS